MSNVELIDLISDEKTHCIANKKIDGFYKNMLLNHMTESMSAETANNIFSNAYKGLDYFADTTINNNISKILCLGKVQSGKTAFFISTIALSFDNGYDIAYVIGGTKNKLRDQNLERIQKEFSNNEKVHVYELNSLNIDDVTENLKNNEKVIIVALKNASKNTNLGLLDEITVYFKNIPSIIVDDEGDEFTPGAPKSKSKNSNAGRTHDVIVDLVNNLNCCTFLSVTATPQANLLISTCDEISPDYAILVTPGYGYTGGNAFHDTYDNNHCIEIKDSDDFNDSIPESFMHCLFFYVLACCIQREKKSFKPYSMLVHPSSLTKVHTMVASKINDYFASVKQELSDSSNFVYYEYVTLFKKHFEQYKIQNNSNLIFSNVMKHLPDVLENISIYEFNVSKSGQEDLKEESNDENLYKIYIGGNMLGRGLTIPNLIVTYMYRDSKETAIDTLYQRARWFGYKLSYFDVCRVYMTKRLKEKFIATVENENDMWQSINSFLLTNTKIKYLPRIFSLNDDKLILVRKTISKTVTYSRVNPGYTYDKSVWYGLSAEDNARARLSNRNLFQDFFETYKYNGHEKQFGISEYQTHYLIELPFSSFYNDFLSKYIYPRGSKFSNMVFEKILKNIESNTIQDKIVVSVMRYKDMEYRSLSGGSMAIGELPQGRNDGTAYDGDKCLENLSNQFHMQIHLVYHDKNNISDYVPMLALNNPITEYNVRYVTGDNEYETI